MIKKKITKYKVAIMILASLLISITLFNVTYAYFTDSSEATANGLDFGIVQFDFKNAEDDPNPLAIGKQRVSGFAGIMPGDTINLSGSAYIGAKDIPAANLSLYDSAWVYLEVSELSISMISAPNTYVDFEESVDSTHPLTGKVYSVAAVQSLESQAITKISARITQEINTNNPSANFVQTEEGSTKYITNTPLAPGSFIDFDGITITLVKGEWGNEWQAISIKFNLKLKALQATNIADKAEAIATFEDPTIDFATGLQTTP